MRIGIDYLLLCGISPRLGGDRRSTVCELETRVRCTHLHGRRQDLMTAFKLRGMPPTADLLREALTLIQGHIA